MFENPPRNGEGDRAKRGGGGAGQLSRPEVMLARRLRRAMSLPEVLLWKHIRGGATGMKFRRQHPVGPYVADFCGVAARLIVEVDGAVHDIERRPQRDAERERFLVENGYRLMRVLAADILHDAAGVATSIAALVPAPLHHPAAPGGPPPRSGEDIL